MNYFRYSRSVIRSSLSLLFSRPSKCGSSSLSLNVTFSNPLVTLVTSTGPFPASPTKETKIGHSIPVWCNKSQEDWNSCIRGLLAILLLVQARRLLAAFPARAHHRLPFNSLHATTHKPRSAELLLSPSVPSLCCCCLGLLLSRCRTLHLSLLKLMSWPCWESYFTASRKDFLANITKKKSSKLSPFSLILLHDCPQKAFVVSQALFVFLDQKSLGIRSWILSNSSISMDFFSIVWFYEFILLNIAEELALGRQIVSLCSRKSGNCYWRMQVCEEMHFISLFVLGWWGTYIPRETNNQWCWFFL